jgi:SAM-dependent methyltransferase
VADAVLAPGLDRALFRTSVTILRISALSTIAAGAAAVHCALLYTDRRFAAHGLLPGGAQRVHHRRRAEPCGAVLGRLRVCHRLHGGRVGAVGDCVVRARVRPGHPQPPRAKVHWREILAGPWRFFVVYAVGPGLNIVFTRAYCTHAGPGMAAALDYCMRGVGVPLAFLVSPISNSLLPEIARLRSLFRLREAFRLIDRLELARRFNRQTDRCEYILNATDDLGQFADGAFDFIYSGIVLQHVGAGNARRYVREFVRVLRPSGLAMFQLPSRLSSPSVLSRLGYRANRLRRELLRGAGFMYMCGVPRETVIADVERSGGRLVTVLEDDSAGPEWTSCMYAVTR